MKQRCLGLSGAKHNFAPLHTERSLGRRNRISSKFTYKDGIHNGSSGRIINTKMQNFAIKRDSTRRYIAGGFLVLDTMSQSQSGP